MSADTHPLPVEARLQSAVTATRTAYALLQAHLPLFEQLEREAERLESVGPLLHPTFFMKVQSEPWREDVREAFRAAAAFVRKMDEVMDRHAKRAGEGTDG